MIWGILIILLGLSLVLGAVFNMHIPLFRIAAGLLVVYLGVRLLLGWPVWHWEARLPDEAAVFSSRELRIEPGQAPARSYTTVFGRTRVDLSDVSLSQGDVNVEVNAVFGEAEVVVAAGQPVEVRAEVVFGRAALPSEAQVAVGRTSYRSPAAAGAPAVLRIKAHAVFGSFVLAQR
jgi:hypothetical protein